MVSVATPPLASLISPILSTSGMPAGNVVGSRTNETNPVTVYLPFETGLSDGSLVAHVPPPVTGSEGPGPKVPEPVYVIVEPSLADAEKTPPGATVKVSPAALVMKLMMSQRILLGGGAVAAAVAAAVAWAFAATPWLASASAVTTRSIILAERNRVNHLAFIFCLRIQLWVDLIRRGARQVCFQKWKLFHYHLSTRLSTIQ